MKSNEALTLELPALAPASLVVVGLSGGMDSVVLLHALLALPRADWQVHAAHIDYQESELMPDAAGARAHCEQLCRDWAIPLHLTTVTVDRTAGKGLEAAARRQRYAFWRALCERLNAAALLLAHHADDASETVLFNLLRGSGIKGLTGFRPYVPWSSGTRMIFLGRPLLAYTRAQLQAYASVQQLRWHEDSFNQDLRFTRNWLRHQLLPAIKTRFLEIDTHLLSLSQHAHEAQLLLDDLAQSDYEDRPAVPPQVVGAALALAPALSPARQKNLLRYWLTQQGVSLPAHRTLNEWLAQIARADAQPHPDDDRHTHWRLGEVDLYYWRGAVHLVRLPHWPEQTDEGAQTYALAWQGAPLYWPPLEQWLALTPSEAWQALGPLRVRTRQAGDQLRVHPKQPRRRLKYLFQVHALAPWLRGRYPLVVNAHNEILALPNLAHSSTLALGVEAKIVPLPSAALPL